MKSLLLESNEMSLERASILKAILAHVISRMTEATKSYISTEWLSISTITQSQTTQSLNISSSNKRQLHQGYLG